MASGSELSHGGRLLAAADAFAAMTEAHANRAALTVPDAAQALNEEVLAGFLDAASSLALIEAAGLPRLRSARPNDLTEREVEVQRVLARGRSNRQIADELVLSPRMVQHHLANVYDKIDVRTRAGAAVFAIEHGLVPAGSDLRQQQDPEPTPGRVLAAEHLRYEAESSRCGARIDVGAPAIAVACLQGHG